MTFPKLSISLFPPKKDGTKYVANGSLRMTIGEAAAFAEWLMGQEGEHDDYLNEPVIRVPAFMYENQSKAGQDYHTVQLIDLDGQQQAPAAKAAPAAKGHKRVPADVPF
tara:strand:- start:190 stop:516 length:327 start_codon:yes stop_codon:yes gene_type:complete